MWNYMQPVEIVFKCGIINEISSFLTGRGFNRGILVCDEFFANSGIINKFWKSHVFSDIQPNPTLKNADECVRAIVDCKAEYVLVLGGGSVIDCAKIAAALAKTRQKAADVHSGSEKLGAGNSFAEDVSFLPVIAVPTTSGTGSEVTCVSVLTDETLGKKAPIFDTRLFPKIAVIDPELTVSMPPKLTAETGMDALAHALEGFWSKNHQPICEAMSLSAAGKIFKSLLKAHKDGSDMEARTQMSEAALIAGLAFALPKTAASHACSYPLTAKYNIPHGEACAFTLAAFARINAEADGKRLHRFAKKLGFADAYAMADRIDDMKDEMGLVMTLKDAEIPEADIPSLAEMSKHPNLLNNPVEMDTEELTEMYKSLANKQHV